jgi:integrase
MIKINHIAIKNQTIFIPEDISKNRKSAVVTLPEKVLKLMIDNGVFNYPGDYYLFSDNYKPGKEYRNEKQFRDYWTRYIRKDLKFPANYKFYSLKDTGITNMLRKYDTITVRDQARHADILMTDTYTPHDIQKANDLIKKHESIF